MCQEFCTKGGVCLSACWDRPGSRHPPPGADAPGVGTPRSRHPCRSRDPPGSRHPQEQKPPWSRPPGAVHTGRYGQQAGGMHPVGMQSCFYFILSRRLIFSLWCTYTWFSFGIWVLTNDINSSQFRRLQSEKSWVYH